MQLIFRYILLLCREYNFYALFCNSLTKIVIESFRLSLSNVSWYRTEHILSPCTITGRWTGLLAPLDAVAQ